MKIEAPILKREVLDGMVSLRFVIGVILMIVSAAICSYLRFHEYDRRLNNYHVTLATQRAFLEKYAHVNRLGAIFQAHVPPRHMGLLLHERTPNPNLVQTLDDDPTDLFQPSFDFNWLVGILGSLLAIVLAYDAMSGERERGTLALIASNPLSLTRVVIEKWLGGNLLTVFPLILAILLASIYIRLNPRVNWAVEEWGAWFVMAIIYAVYLSVFFTAGLLISCSMRRSSVSILALSLLWVLAVVFIPSLGLPLSKVMKPVPPPEVIAQQLQTIEQERESAIRARINELIRSGLSVEQAQARMSEELDEISRPYRTKAARLTQGYERQLADQRRLARWISAFSPTFCMIQATSELAGIGASSHDHLTRSIDEWSRLTYDLIQRKVQRLRAANPNFGPDDFIDVSDIPTFIYREQPLSSRWDAAVTYIGLLLLYEAGLLVLTLLLSRRTDVRPD
jgi:ABC-2 type transport system permease protein